MIYRTYRNVRYFLRSMWFRLQAETKVLAALPSEPAEGYTPAQIALSTRLDTSKVAYLLGVLEDQGLVRRTKDLLATPTGSYRNRWVYSVTGKGIMLLVDRGVE